MICKSNIQRLNSLSFSEKVKQDSAGTVDDKSFKSAETWSAAIYVACSSRTCLCTRRYTLMRNGRSVKRPNFLYTTYSPTIVKMKAPLQDQLSEQNTPLTLSGTVETEPHLCLDLHSHVCSLYMFKSWSQYAESRALLLATVNLPLYCFVGHCEHCAQENICYSEHKQMTCCLRWLPSLHYIKPTHYSHALSEIHWGQAQAAEASLSEMKQASQAAVWLLVSVTAVPVIERFMQIWFKMIGKFSICVDGELVFCRIPAKIGQRPLSDVRGMTAGHETWGKGVSDVSLPKLLVRRILKKQDAALRSSCFPCKFEKYNTGIVAVDLLSFLKKGAVLLILPVAVVAMGHDGFDYFMAPSYPLVKCFLHHQVSPGPPDESPVHLFNKLEIIKDSLQPSNACLLSHLTSTPYKGRGNLHTQCFVHALGCSLNCSASLLFVTLSALFRNSRLLEGGKKMRERREKEKESMRPSTECIVQILSSKQRLDLTRVYSVLLSLQNVAAGSTHCRGEVTGQLRVRKHRARPNLHAQEDHFLTEKECHPRTFPRGMTGLTSEVFIMDKTGESMCPARGSSAAVSGAVVALQVWSFALLILWKIRKGKHGPQNQDDFPRGTEAFLSQLASGLKQNGRKAKQGPQLGPLARADKIELKDLKEGMFDSVECEIHDVRTDLMVYGGGGGVVANNTNDFQAGSSSNAKRKGTSASLVEAQITQRRPFSVYQSSSSSICLGPDRGERDAYLHFSVNTKSPAPHGSYRLCWFMSIFYCGKHQGRKLVPADTPEHRSCDIMMLLEDIRLLKATRVALISVPFGQDAKDVCREDLFCLQQVEHESMSNSRRDCLKIQYVLLSPLSSHLTPLYDNQRFSSPLSVSLLTRNSHYERRWPDCTRISQLSNELDRESYVWSHMTPSQQHQLMTLAARDSSISPAVPQRLLVPVLQMLHDGPEPLCCSEWPAVTANALGLSDEFSCHFYYAAIHSVTRCVQGLQSEDYAERIKCGQSALRLV
ncbi:hypothetical protein D9C73_011064 [Collichthys lucidus]|uniref:Uncharacterized protein n=1 Tax=Collichthys lucidus TaxID=240159 RepID=A0A4U5UPL8_COLLU|nr:hypothetical protein D9C73_011064 [Collichthys lucidus]